MKSTVQKILAVLVVVLLVAEIIHASKLNQKDSVTLAEERPLLIWYTDPDIQEYMQQSAEAAAAQYGVQVETELVSEVDYIENISERSVAETMTGPDLYVLGSSQMEKGCSGRSDRSAGRQTDVGHLFRKGGPCSNLWWKSHGISVLCGDQCTSL